MLKNMQTIRANSGMTYKQMSEKLGVSLSAVYNLEYADGNPSLTLIISVCLLFDVDPNTLIGWEN